MRCEALHCMHNDGTGYCTNQSYVVIEQTGQCSSYYVPYSSGPVWLRNLEGDKTDGRSDV